MLSEYYIHKALQGVKQSILSIKKHFCSIISTMNYFCYEWKFIMAVFIHFLLFARTVRCLKNGILSKWWKENGGKCCKTRFLMQEEHSGDSALSRRNTYVRWWHGPLYEWSIGRKLWQNIKIITSQGRFKVLILLVEHMVGLFGSTLSWPWED